MFKSCSKCGKIHSTNFVCTKGKVYKGGEERLLRSKYAWTLKSIEIRERANYLCEVCKTKGIYTYEGLEVHHIHKVADSPELLLENSNLICLCTECHKKADKGQLTIDYLSELARLREKELAPPVC